MTSQAEVIRALREFAHAEVFKGWRKMLTGRRTATNTITLAGAPAGKTWVRAHDASREQTAVWGFVGIPNVTVYVAPGVDGDNRIMAIDYAESVQSHGSKVVLAQQPPLDGNLNTVIVAGRNILPGRVRPYASSGSMLVYVEPFAHHEGRYAGGTIDLTSDIPATAGTCAWVAVALDPATDTLYSYAGTDSYDAPANLDEADAHAISIPDGYIPLAAVVLEEGMTEVTAATRIVDLRPHFYMRGGLIRDLDDLANVNTTGKAGGDALVWDAGASEWVAAAGGAIDVSDGTTTVSPATELLFDAAKFTVTDNGGGQAEVSLAPGAVVASGSKTRITGTVLYDNTLGANGEWASIANADLTSGVGNLADYDYLELRAYGLRSTVAAARDDILVRVGTGGSLDTIAANYSIQAEGADNTTQIAGRIDSPIVGFVTGATALANSVANLFMRIDAPGSAAMKVGLSMSHIRDGAASQGTRTIHWQWENTAAIDILSLTTDNPGTALFGTGARLQIIGYKEEAIGGLDVSTADVSNPPTDAEFDSALGTPASVGAGYQCLLDDNGADTNVYLVVSNGTSWHYVALTKAT
jgi:hypothetical protein